MLKTVLVILVFAIVALSQSSPNRGQWTTVAAVGSPTARHEDGVVAYEGKLYLIGGRGVKPVEVFDPKTRVWKALSPTPIEMHHFQPAVLGKLIYIAAALTGRYPKEPPIENVYILDPAKDTWTKSIEIPAHRRRGGAGTVVQNGKIYIAGGIQDGHTSGTVGWLDEFDPKTGAWRELPDAPHIRDHFPAIVHGGKLYCIGGRNTSFHKPDEFTAFFAATVKEVDVYDFGKRAWSTLPQPLPVPTAAGGLAALGNHLYYMGGETGQRPAHNETQSLDPKTGQWTLVAPLQQGRHAIGAVVIGGKIYTVAGSGNRGGGPELTSIEEFSPKP